MVSFLACMRVCVCMWFALLVNWLQRLKASEASRREVEAKVPKDRAADFPSLSPLLPSEAFLLLTCGAISTRPVLMKSHCQC